MKILITTELYEPTVNGVITSIRTLKQSLEQLGHEVRILTLSKKHSQKEDPDVYFVPSYGAGKIYPGARVALSVDYEVVAQIIKWSPDIIHTQCEFSTFRIARLLSKELMIPIVHTYHTVYEDYTHYFSPNKAWGKKMVSYYSKRVLRNTETVIVPTEKVRDLLKGYGVRQEIHVIPTGIPMDKFYHSNDKNSSLRSAYNISPNNHLLVSIGRLAKEKNLEEIIHYLAKIDDPTISLLIVGDGPYRPVLEEMVKELHLTENVHFTGMIDPENVPVYYQLADIFLSASTSETQGLSYIEALASGTPALCRKDTCLNDVVKDGYNGYQYTDFKEFEERLYSMLLNPQLRKRLAVNAFVFARETYSAESFGYKVEVLYKQAIEQYQFNHVLIG